MNWRKSDTKLLDDLERARCDLQISPLSNGWCWSCSDRLTYGAETCRDAIKQRIADAAGADAVRTGSKLWHQIVEMPYAKIGKRAREEHENALSEIQTLKDSITQLREQVARLKKANQRFSSINCRLRKREARIQAETPEELRMETRYLKSNASPRFVTLKTLKKQVLPNFLVGDDIPTDETLRTWFDDWKIPRIKNNPKAIRGGGAVLYSVSAFEKAIRSRLLAP